VSPEVYAQLDHHEEFPAFKLKSSPLQKINFGNGKSSSSPLPLILKLGFLSEQSHLLLEGTVCWLVDALMDSVLFLGWSEVRKVNTDHIWGP
jgi:hypothetical protein